MRKTKSAAMAAGVIGSWAECARRLRGAGSAIGALLICLSLPVQAEPFDGERFAIVNEGSPQRPLYALALQGDGRGMAVGSMGTLLVTDNGGRDWSSNDLATGVAGSHASLAVLDGTVEGPNWIVVGQQGLIRHSGDEGKTWTAPEQPVERRLLAVSANRSGLAVAVGAFGTVLVSANAGEDWDAVSVGQVATAEDGNVAHFYDVHVGADGSILIVGEYGLIIGSSDAGRTWERRRYGRASLLGLAVYPDGRAYAVGQSGALVHSRDGGRTWRDIPTGYSGSLLGVLADADGNIWVPGMRNFLVSRDHGRSWDRVSGHDFQRNWYGAIASGSDGILVAGHSSRILRIDRDEARLSRTPEAESVKVSAIRR